MPDLRLFRFAVLAALALPACGEPCHRLSVALCDGGTAEYCAQVDQWLATRLIDPATRDPLQGEARVQMCTTIYGSVDIFNAYRFKAKQKILGEPDFTMKSSTPAANKADPDPKPAVVPDAKPTPPVATPADDAKPEEPKQDESIKADERPDDGEEDKPGANMSD
jgi:hypothetical protein